MYFLDVWLGPAPERGGAPAVMGLEGMDIKSTRNSSGFVQ
jgi:hypothetical protein